MKAKLILTLLVTILFCGFTSAQDVNKIALSAYIPDNCGVPPASRKVLDTKLKSLVTSCGFGAESNKRFILTSQINILTEDILPTTPVMFSYTLSVNMYIGDGVSGTLFSTTSMEVKGVGKTKDKAYLQALKAINPKNAEFKAFIEEGKQKIIDYYKVTAPSIISKAQSLATSQKYKEAIYVLSEIPQECTEFYEQANKLTSEFYIKHISEEGKILLAEARGVWNSSQDRAAADKAGEILAKINPAAPQYDEAAKLGEEIAKRIEALDAREWQFKLQKQKDETEIAKLQINAAKDIAIEQARNQPDIVYDIYWW